MKHVLSKTLRMVAATITLFILSAIVAIPDAHATEPTRDGWTFDDLEYWYNQFQQQFSDIRITFEDDLFLELMMPNGHIQSYDKRLNVFTPGRAPTNHFPDFAPIRSGRPIAPVEPPPPINMTPTIPSRPAAPVPPEMTAPPMPPAIDVTSPTIVRPPPAMAPEMSPPPVSPAIETGPPTITNRPIGAAEPIPAVRPSVRPPTECQPRLVLRRTPPPSTGPALPPSLPPRVTGAIRNLSTRPLTPRQVALLEGIGINLAVGIVLTNEQVGELINRLISHVTGLGQEELAALGELFAEVFPVLDLLAFTWTVNDNGDLVFDGAALRALNEHTGIQIPPIAVMDPETARTLRALWRDILDSPQLDQAGNVFGDICRIAIGLEPVSILPPAQPPLAPIPPAEAPRATALCCLCNRYEARIVSEGYFSNTTSVCGGNSLSNSQPAYLNPVGMPGNTCADFDTAPIPVAGASCLADGGTDRRTFYQYRGCSVSTESCETLVQRFNPELGPRIAESCPSEKPKNVPVGGWGLGPFACPAEADTVRTSNGSLHCCVSEEFFRKVTSNRPQ